MSIKVDWAKYLEDQENLLANKVRKNLHFFVKKN